MNVTAEDDLFASELLEVVLKSKIARFGRNGLALPAGEGMRTGGRDAAPVALRGLNDSPPQADELGAHFTQRDDGSWASGRTCGVGLVRLETPALRVAVLILTRKFGAKSRRNRREGNFDGNAMIGKLNEEARREAADAMSVRRAFRRQQRSMNGNPGARPKALAAQAIGTFDSGIHSNALQPNSNRLREKATDYSQGAAVSSVVIHHEGLIHE